MDGFLLPFSVCVRHTQRDYSITLIQEVSIKRSQQSLETRLKEGDRSIKLQFAFQVMSCVEAADSICFLC